MAGIISVAIAQKINLLKPVFIGTILGICAFVGLIIWAAMVIPKETFNTWSTAVSAMILLGLICWFIIQAMVAKINVCDAFIEGAKDGFSTAIGIIPYLIAILVAVGMFRASGAMDMLVNGIGFCFAAIGLNTDFVPALPTALMRPLSGGGARGLMVDAMAAYGADSFVGRLVSIVQGSTDTTFYILAVYFGSVNIKNTRYAVVCGLIADFFGILSSIILAYIFFH
jgi:spore maturation protein SpmB